jgi:hypothetical protein
LQHESVVGFILHDVPDSHKSGIFGQFRQLLLDVLGAQVHPTDHPFDDRKMVREIQQPPRFIRTLARLDSNASVQFDLLEFALEIGGQKVLPDPFELVGDPWIFLRAVIPEMLVAIDPHKITNDEGMCAVSCSLSIL